MSLSKTLDEILPQTQCGECGYPGCMPYAQAMAAKLAPIDRCPPGGERVLRALGETLNIDPTPYLADVIAKTRPPQLAVIREAECIGCTKCIQACPVDAIVGSAKFMHSVLATECTGCGLCIDPCPVDCIDLVPIPELSYDPAFARERFHAHERRERQQEQIKADLYREKRQLLSESHDQQQEQAAKKSYILEAMQRVRAKKHE